MKTKSKSNFINLSNHPSSKWSAEQHAAAEKYGEIIDISFPQIPSGADERYIMDATDEYVKMVMNMASSGNAVVHLMGEMTFSFLMVSKLQALGYECLASTTERIVDESEPGAKKVIFKFTRFRKYQNLWR